MGAEVEILKLLKAGGGEYTSGQSLSSGLGVSRTAVWKHIGALRKMGYSIEASPSKGYRLNASAKGFNGVEVSSGLTTDFIGRKIHFYDTIDSTNKKAFELGRGGEVDGAAVLADSQTVGKGRIGRRWESPEGVNLYTSILLRPSILPQNAHNLIFVSAIATAEAVSLFSKARPIVKWPNDVLLGPLKVAGILMEMDSEPDRVHFVIAGIGVNINMRKSSFPEYIKETATSLFEERGSEVSRAEFAQALYSAFEKWYKIYFSLGFTHILEEWKRYFDAVGRPIRVTSFNNITEGICAGVDTDGALLVKAGSGNIERVISGDMESVK